MRPDRHELLVHVDHAEEIVEAPSRRLVIARLAVERIALEVEEEITRIRHRYRRERCRIDDAVGRRATGLRIDLQRVESALHADGVTALGGTVDGVLAEQIALPATKMARPDNTSHLRPNRSDSGPTKSWPTAKATKKLLKVSASSRGETPRSTPICGKAGRMMLVANDPSAASPASISSNSPERDFAESIGLGIVAPFIAVKAFNTGIE